MAPTTGIGAAATSDRAWFGLRLRIRHFVGLDPGDDRPIADDLAAAAQRQHQLIAVDPVLP